jgi:ribonuclease-3
MDFKTVLQEITQEKFHSLPLYEILREDGTEHNKKFHIVVKINRKIIGEGKGKTKKEAGQMAAKKAIETLKKDKDNA